MSKFLLEIITPDKIAYSQQVDMVTAPSASGVIGILSHHVPLFTRLVEGELKIIQGTDETFLAIGGGFMEVTQEKVVVLVTAAFNADELNEHEVLAARKRAEEALASKPTGEALLDAQAMFKRSIISMRILGKKKRTSGMGQNLPS